MAPIKFEENIKDKLEKRTLSPSSQGWSKLNDRLDADEKNSKNPIFWWLSIAAGLLIMIAVSVQFFNSDESDQFMPEVVEENIESDTNRSLRLEEKLEKNELKPKENKSIELVNQDDRVEEEVKALPTTNELKIIDYKKVTNSKANKTIKLAEKKDLKEAENLLTNIEKINTKQVLIDEELLNKALSTAMQDLKSEHSGVSDVEIDSLLKLASKALIKEKLNIETTKTVNAILLLESVEDEMGQSYRGKVFEALKESYKTVKTAVANRNN